MFVTNWISTTKIQKISEITNFFRHYFLSRTEVKLAPTSGINLEKVDTSKPCIIDENFVVLVGKCSNTKKTYLVKYAKRMAEYKDMDYGNLGLLKNEFKLVGAYPIDEETYT